MNKFKVGDRVKFVSKYGDLVTGVIVRYDSVPVIGGEEIRPIVRGKPFLPDEMEVDCIVSDDALTLIK